MAEADIPELPRADPETAAVREAAARAGVEVELDTFSKICEDINDGEVPGRVDTGLPSGDTGTQLPVEIVQSMTDQQFLQYAKTLQTSFAMAKVVAEGKGLNVSNPSAILTELKAFVTRPDAFEKLIGIQTLDDAGALAFKNDFLKSTTPADISQMTTDIVQNFDAAVDAAVKKGTLSAADAQKAKQAANAAEKSSTFDRVITVLKILGMLGAIGAGIYFLIMLGKAMSGCYKIRADGTQVQIDSEQNDNNCCAASPSRCVCGQCAPCAQGETLTCKKYVTGLDALATLAGALVNGTTNLINELSSGEWVKYLVIAGIVLVAMFVLYELVHVLKD